MQVKSTFAAVILVLSTIEIIGCISIKRVCPVPEPCFYNPCPLNFHYEFDGRYWFGIVKIYPQTYNQFWANRITMNVTLAVKQYIPNLINLELLKLNKSVDETYKDIAARRPISYRVNFPFDNEFPALIRIQVNGKQVCSNLLIRNVMNTIELGNNLYIPTQDSDDEEEFVVEQETAAESFNLDLVKNDLKATNSKCGVFDDEFKYTELISGGNKIAAGTWPWLVAIYRKPAKTNNLDFTCSGNLLTNRIVLTAAHCFRTRLGTVPAEEILLVFGRYNIGDWTENAVISGVTEIVIHPDYLSNKKTNLFDADIAIVTTKKFIEYDSKIRPICLWTSTANESPNILRKNGTLVGWGQPFENLESNIPRRLNLPVVRNQRCFPNDKGIVKRRIFCAGIEKKGYAPCNGDSGTGFAIWKNGAWFLRGIVSAALGDPILNRCELNTYVIFTDVIHFRSWLANFI